MEESFVNKKKYKLGIFVKNLFMAKARLLFQELIKIICIMLFYFVWIRFFIKKHFIALVLSSLASAITYLLVYFITRKKMQKNGLKLKEKEDAQNMFLSLAFAHNQGKFLEKIAKQNHEKITRKTHHVIVDEKEKFAIYFEESLSGLNVQKLFEINRLLSRENLLKIIILCREISDKQVYGFLDSFKQKNIILNQYETYEKIFKENNIFPEITTQTPKEKKLDVKDLFAYSFNKKRTKGYLFSAFILILSSLFVRATLYYCVISSLLLVFALISYFNPKFNKKEGQII